MTTLTAYSSRELGAQVCPCGYLGDLAHQCSCTPVMLQRYRSRTSGPLLDRIDIHIEVPAVRYRDLADGREAEGSSSIASRVERSREVQTERFTGTKIHCNAQIVRNGCSASDGWQKPGAIENAKVNAVLKKMLQPGFYSPVARISREMVV